MTDDQRLINVIREYREYLNEPGPKWPEMEFEKNSYSRWAVDEIFITIISHPDWSVIRCVEDFRDKSFRYAHKISNYNEANFIFEIAYDTACDLLDILGGIS